MVWWLTRVVLATRECGRGVNGRGSLHVEESDQWSE